MMPDPVGDAIAAHAHALTQAGAAVIAMQSAGPTGLIQAHETALQALAVAEARAHDVHIALAEEQRVAGTRALLGGIAAGLIARALRGR